MAKKVEVPQRLSEIEAAIRLRVTPTLLKYFTENSVKSGDKRTLPFTEDNGVRWYDAEAVDAYDTYLRAPWPKSGKAQRPHLPDAIRKEIMLEAACCCPVCGHESSGEAAHIEAVASTLSHHPSNLIWLCPNHHTVVDKIGAVHNVTMKTVKVLKEVLVDRKLRLLHLERAASNGFLHLIRTVEKLSAMLGDASLHEAKAGLEAITSADLESLKLEAGKTAATAVLGTDKKAILLKSLAKSVSESAKTASVTKPASLSSFAASAAAARADYLHKTNQIDCSLCNGDGTWKGSDCPVCDGAGMLDRDDAARLDLSEFEEVECPVCNGSRRHKGDDCPACGGEGVVERRYLSRIDVREYEDVRCPVCKGSKRHNGEWCPPCDGEGQLERRYADQIELRDYEMVECPLCKKRGRQHDCSVCHGDHLIEGRFADCVDLGDYADVDCKLCDGVGRAFGDDCPPCNGEGRMERRYFDRIDWSDWEKVRCPRCKGEGHNSEGDCSGCGGEGRLFRGDLWRLD